MPASNFRTTWLASSLTALRERSLFSAYLGHLPRDYHDLIVGSIAGQWAPIEVARQHYDACDQLGLDKETLEQIGVSVTQRVHGTALSTVVKLAKQGGVNPWVGLAQLNRLWGRVWDGGGVGVYRVGPKDAVVEIAAWPLADISYLRDTMPSVVRAMVELFCRRAYSHLHRPLCSRQSLGIHISWA
ncbi:MAG TPA: hypothetical protein VI299_08100 [Polyangiales bacterium]